MQLNEKCFMEKRKVEKIGSDVGVIAGIIIVTKKEFKLDISMRVHKGAVTDTAPCAVGILGLLNKGPENEYNTC